MDTVLTTKKVDMMSIWADSDISQDKTKKEEKTYTVLNLRQRELSYCNRLRKISKKPLALQGEWP